MTIENKFASAIGAAASVTDMTKAQTGGGDYTPPEAGPTRLRLVGYVETGKHATTYQGKPKTEDSLELTFELSGPKHQPREHEGKKYPHLLVIRLNKSLNEKAKFFKLFQLLNWEGKATHMAQLLGAAFKGRVVHRTYKDKQGKERVAAELFDKATGSWTIEPPRKLDDETGDYLPLTVDAPITPLKCFLWDHADMDQWNSIFIDGEYPAEEAKDDKPARPARSKNVIQAKIKSALNFKDSPIYTLLLNNGQPLDIPAVGDPEDDGEAESTDEAAQPAARPDPLAG